MPYSACVLHKDSLTSEKYITESQISHIFECHNIFDLLLIFYSSQSKREIYDFCWSSISDGLLLKNIRAVEISIRIA